MTKEFREPTAEEKEVLRPDLGSFVRDRITDAKEAIHKTEVDIKQVVTDLFSRPQQTVDDSKELLRGYGDWIKTKTEGLEATIESTVKQAIKVFSPIQPLQKTLEELETRTDNLTKEVEKLISDKDKKTPPADSQ